VEIAMQSAINLVEGNVPLSVRFCDVDFPSIKHKLVSESGIKKILLTFGEGTPLNNIVEYLQSALGVKNIPRKKKLSLGQGFRLLDINNEVRSNPNKYKK
jgi:hypothetical protein